MKTRVSGVPYEVELPYGMDEGGVIAELERENFMMRARMERLENELKIAEEHISKLMIDLHNERNKKT